MKYELLSQSTKDENLISLVFRNRNVKENEIFDYINCDKDFRTNPYDYVNLDKAEELLQKHIDNKSKIYILGDCDCDGYASTTLTHKLIKELDPEANVNILLHKEKRHGLYEDIMERVLNLKPDLLIIPDAGSNDKEEIKKLHENGIDVLVIDHHEGEDHEYGVIVNCQFNNTNKDLSGTAMVMKLAEAMIGEKANKYFDLVALSLIADSMALNNLENRYYVKYGLTNINNKFLYYANSCEKEAKNKDIGFRVAPIINAIIRVGSMEYKEILIKAMIEEDGQVELPIRKNGKKTRPYEYYEAAVKVAEWCKSEQKNIIEKELLNHTFNEDDTINITYLSDEFNRGVTGYLGNVISSKTFKPTLAIKMDEDGIYKGSARAYKVPDFKDFLLSLNLFEKCEGHQGAFGVEITKENLDKLIKIQKNLELPKEKVYKVDKIYKNEIIDRMDVACISNLESIWGKEIEAPLFAIELKDIMFSCMGANKDTLKIEKDGIIFIKFKCDKEIVDKVCNGLSKDINIVGTFNVNVFNNFANYQVLMEDFEVVKEHSAIESVFDASDDFDDIYDLF